MSGPPAVGICWPILLVLLAGCATSRVPIALFSDGDSRTVEGATRIDLLPEAALPKGTRAWGRLESDHLVLYRPVADAGARHQQVVYHLGRSGLPIGGYERADGRHVDFTGFVRRVGDDLHFHRDRARGMEKQETPTDVSLSVTDVRSVEAFLPDVGQTVILVGSILLIGTVGIGLAIASSLRESLF